MWFRRSWLYWLIRDTATDHGWTVAVVSAVLFPVIVIAAVVVTALREAWSWATAFFRDGATQTGESTSSGKFRW